MVSYGPWQQDPDFLQFHTISGDSDAVDPTSGAVLFEYGKGTTARSSGFQNPRYPITEQDLRFAVQAAYEAETPGSGGTVWGTEYAWVYNLSTPDWDSTWGATVVKRRFRITPRSYFYNPPNYGHSDPDAVGIDYEGQPYDPANPWASGPGAIQYRGVNAAASRLRGIWFAGNGPVSEGVPLANTEVRFVPVVPAGQEVEEASLAIVPGPAEPSDPNNPADAFLASDIDLTSLLDPVTGGGILWTRSGYAPSYTDPGLPAQGRVRYGWGFENVRIDTMVRPPRWRWVYADDSETYRRTFPRPHNRNFPPSKAHGSGNRISGGYL